MNTWTPTRRTHPRSPAGASPRPGTSPGYRDPGPRSATDPGRRPLWGAIVTALVLIALGAGWVMTRPAVWTSSVSWMVVPAADVPADAMAGAYETLSHGQVVESVAQLVRLRGPDVLAGSGNGSAAGTRVDVEVTNNTALVTARVEGGTGSQVLAGRDLLSRVAAEAARETLDGFEVKEVDRSAPELEDAQRPARLLAVLAAALLAAVAVHQVAHHILTVQALRRFRNRS